MGHSHNHITSKNSFTGITAPYSFTIAYVCSEIIHGKQMTGEAITGSQPIGEMSAPRLPSTVSVQQQQLSLGRLTSDSSNMYLQLTARYRATHLQPFTPYMDSKCTRLECGNVKIQ